MVSLQVNEDLGRGGDGAKTQMLGVRTCSATTGVSHATRHFLSPLILTSTLRTARLKVDASRSLSLSGLLLTVRRWRKKTSATLMSGTLSRCVQSLARESLKRDALAQSRSLVTASRPTSKKLGASRKHLLSSHPSSSYLASTTRATHKFRAFSAMATALAAASIESYGNYDLLTRTSSDASDIKLEKWQSRKTGLTLSHVNIECGYHDNPQFRACIDR